MRKLPVGAAPTNFRRCHDERPARTLTKGSAAAKRTYSPRCLSIFQLTQGSKRAATPLTAPRCQVFDTTDTAPQHTRAPVGGSQRRLLGEARAARGHLGTPERQLTARPPRAACP